MKRGILLAFVLWCTTDVLVSGRPSSSANEEEVISKSSVQIENEGASTTEQQEFDLIRQQRDEYQKIVRQVAGRLRRFQGIAALHSSDIRLAGDPVSTLKGEFATPNSISLVEEEWIRLAGEIRAAECSNLLLNRVADPREKVPVNSRALLPANPALHSLCQIGEPACREALKRIPLEANERRCVSMVQLLKTVSGKSRTHSQLVRLQKDAADEVQIARIASAIAQLTAEESTEVR